MQIEIRPAVEDDARAASEVLRRSITECCTEDHRDDPEIIAAWIRNKTPETVRGWLLNDHIFSVVAVTAGEVVGFAASSTSGEVLLCYVVPEVRFIGTGRALLFSIEQLARDAGVLSLHLHSTLTVRTFYARNGFKASGPPVLAFGMESLPMAKNLNIVTSSDSM
jgi:GNAT superfamily N-acetyltransferase